MLGAEVLNKIQLSSVNYVLVSFKKKFLIYIKFSSDLHLKFEMLKKKLPKLMCRILFHFFSVALQNWKKKKKKM